MWDLGKFILSAFSDEIANDLKTQMDVLDEFRINHIEIRGVNGRNITQYTNNEVKELKKRLDDRGFRISAIGSPIGKIWIGDEFDPHLDLFKHTLEIAAIFETKYIRMFSFFIPAGEDPYSYREEVMNRWMKFIKAAEGSGIMLLHENEKDIYGDIPERCLDLLKSMNCSYMKAVFDPANFVQCDVETYPKAYEVLKDFIVYMHIKDAMYKDHSVVPSGYGDGNIKDILRKLYRGGYDGFLSIEPHLGTFTGFEFLEPNSKAKGMPKGGPKQFAIAYEALIKIIKEVETEAST